MGTHEFDGDPVDGVGLVHAPAVVGEGGAHVHGRLLVPEGEEVVEAVVRERLHRRSRAVPRRLKRLGGSLWRSGMKGTCERMLEGVCHGNTLMTPSHTFPSKYKD